MKIKDSLTIADLELLSQAYINLVEAGLVLATVDYADFLEAVCTGDTFDYEVDGKLDDEQQWHNQEMTRLYGSNWREDQNNDIE